MDHRDTTIMLVDDSGLETAYEFLDSFEVNGKTCAVVFETNEPEGPDEILRLELDEHGEEVFAEIEDDAELHAARLAWDGIQYGEDEAAKMRRCRVCGCTDENACPGGCSWVEPDLCSRCAEKAGNQ